MGAFFGVIAAWGVLLACAQPQEDYLRLLGLAQKAMHARKSEGVGSINGGDVPGAAFAALRLHRKFFSLRDSWTVEFTPVDGDGIARSVKRAPLVFDFKVTAINAAPLAASIDVRQRLSSQTRPSDAKIDHMSIEVNEQFVVVRKSIYNRDASSPIVIATNGQSNLSVGFSAYPIDLPNLGSSRGEPLREIPEELKGKLREEASRFLDFNFEDAYARSMRAIWRDDDTWPLYVRTPVGTALLISSQRDRRS